MGNKVLKVNPKDNVIVALQNLAKDEAVQYNGETYILQEDIPAKHKFYVNDMNAGDEVIMYGVLVGKIQHFVLKGMRMSTDNLKHAAEPYVYRKVNYE